MSGAKPKGEGEDNGPVLTDEDEALLDQAWAQIAEEDRQRKEAEE